MRYRSGQVQFDGLIGKSLIVHRRRPSGASEQAKAINRASKAPSKVTSRGGVSRGLRSGLLPALPQQIVLQVFNRPIGNPQRGGRVGNIPGWSIRPASHKINARHG